MDVSASVAWGGAGSPGEVDRRTDEVAEPASRVDPVAAGMPSEASRPAYSCA